MIPKRKGGKMIMMTPPMQGGKNEVGRIPGEKKIEEERKFGLITKV
jgi:hypothetical protein